MPVTFILGRAGTGKTRFCLDALSVELGKPGEARKLILLVPEQASFQIERALALRTTQHGYWRAEVLSFTRLAHRVFAEGRGEVNVLNAAARTMALRRVAAAMGDSLRCFGAAAESNGLFTQLDRFIEEVLLEDVTPEALAAAAERLEDAAARRKATTIAQLYAAYLAWLGRDRIDPCQRLAVLRERLEQTPWLQHAFIWVDGFAGFTGQELATLTTLARLAGEVWITLLVDPQSPVIERRGRTPDLLDPFHRTESTYQRLVELFAEAGVELRRPMRLQGQRGALQVQMIARLEAHLALPLGVREPPVAAAPMAAGAADVRVLACKTHRDELREAASFIRRRVIASDGALRFRDFAVIARDLEPFADSVAEVFEEYEVPYFLDRRRPMATHALTRFVQALFEALLRDFPVSATTRLLASGLLPLSREQAERLQNVVADGQARGAALWRQPAWDFGCQKRSRRLDDGVRAAHGAEAEKLDAARLRVFEALEPLVELAGAPRPAPGTAWAERLHTATEALAVRGRIESWIAAARQEQSWETAELHRLAWEVFCGVLEDLHDVLGETPLRVGEVAAVVGAALSEATLGLTPPTLDQVLVGAIERTRHPEIKHAWVFAFNEGVFPASPPEDCLLGTAEREALAAAGLRGPASHRDEVFAERLLAYIAFTRPTQSLTISYATVGPDGERQFASPLLDEVRRALPELHVQEPEECPLPSCLTEVAAGYLAASRPGHRYDRLCEQLSASPRQGAKLGWLLRGRKYDNACAPVGNYRRASSEGNVQIVWDCSPTEIETYLQCPFKHLARYGLKLQPPFGPTQLNLGLGSAAHEVMAAVVHRALDASADVRDLADEHWLTFLREALEEHRRGRPDDLAARQPQLAFLTDTLAGLLQELVLAHAARWRRGQFQPLACELEFAAEGGAGVRPAFELSLPAGGLVRVKGKIDRVDCCRHAGQTYLLAYDYKSSVGPIGANYLTQDRLQLFTYLLALDRAFGGEVGVHPVGVFLAPLYPALGVLDTKYAAAAEEQEQRMYLYRPRGLFDAAIARLLDEQLGSQHSPVARMRLKKDGDLAKPSDARAADEIEQRLDLAQKTILHAAGGVATGNIEVAPLLEADRLACNWCEYRAVCRFERAFNRIRVAERTLPTLSGAGENGEGGETWS